MAATRRNIEIGWYRFYRIPLLAVSDDRATVASRPRADLRATRKRPFNGIRGGRHTHWFGYIASSDWKTTEAVERTIPQAILLRANEVKR